MGGESPKGYRHAGDYQLDKLFLALPDGTGQDIRGIVTEINIYQDINKHYMECDFVVNDAKGIIENFDGVGIVQMTFSTTDDDELELSFATHELSNKVRVTDRSEAYTIHGVSEEAYVTTIKKISRAFGKGSGNTIDKMIQGLYKEFFTESKKPISVDKTKAKARFIIPNYTVDDTIKFMKEEAVSDSIASKFFFYETFEGYNFKDLNTLIQNQNPLLSFKYNPMNYAESDTEKQFDDALNILSFAQSTQKNYFVRVLKGQFKSKTINIDLLRKKKTEVKFDFDKQYTRFNTFAKKKFNSISVPHDAVINLMTSRKGHDQDSVLSAEGHVPKRINEEKAYRDSYMENFMQVVNLKVPGNPILNVGKVIEIEIPKMNFNNEEDERADKYISGKYLITASRHNFNGEVYTTSLQCVRDAGEEV